jgi:hypothetical protein
LTGPVESATQSRARRCCGREAIRKDKERIGRLSMPSAILSGDNLWHRSVSYIDTKDELRVPHTRLGYRRFQKQPTATEVCAFLLHVRGLGLDTGFRHVSGGFPKAAWRRLASRDAPCSFSGELRPELDTTSERTGDAATAG